MKSSILAFIFIFSLSGYAKEEVPRFSAFSDGKNLHITVMGDHCNSYNLILDVDPICKDDRMIRNFALECSASFTYLATEMYCGPETTPRTMSISLKKANIAKEAKELTLSDGFSSIKVKLDGIK